MENARNDIEALDDLELDAPASVPAASDDVAAPARPAKRPRREAPTDEERRQMHASFNDRISYLCKMAALVVALVSLATIALGQELPQFVLMGLCLSVALLAIAMLQDHHQRKRYPHRPNQGYARMIIEALKAFLIGIVEGITEWLPISSTGHMILVDEFVKLQVSDEFLALFLVVIQLGAIMAVLILYFHKLNPFSPKKDAVEKKSTWRLWGMVAIGCIPAAVIGLLFDDLVNEYFYNKVTVAAMLILYGVVFIVLERRNRRRLREAEAALEAPRGRHARVSYGDVSDEAEASLFKITDVDEIDWKTALKIGCFQVLAIIPGTSRSGATIIGGMLAGCSRTAAAEFTFFLAIPIMFGWGLVKCIKFVAAGIAMTSTEILVLAVGIITAFAMSVVAIKFLMGYIKKNDFTAFGWYRIVVGVLVLGYFVFESMGMLP